MRASTVLHRLLLLPRVPASALLKLELAQLSTEAVRTLPDKEITLFQLDQLAKVAHHITAQAAQPAQGEKQEGRT